MIQDNKSARGEVSIADVVKNIRAESSAQAARRLLRSARQRTKKAVAAKGSRNVIFSSGYLYFLVLEKPWTFTAALSLGAYAATIFACFVLSLPLPLYNGFEETEDGDASQAALALRFATAHVTAGGPAEVLPTNEAGRFVSYLSMLAGIVVNVFVFAAVLAKFQSPQKDLVWSTKGVMAKRDGVPTLLVRVGNLRCHTLYNPTIRCTLLSRHVTAEGEGFMKKEEVEVMQPATISGVHTIACAVDKQSPLFPILQTSRFVHCPCWARRARAASVRTATKKTTTIPARPIPTPRTSRSSGFCTSHSRRWIPCTARSCARTPRTRTTRWWARRGSRTLSAWMRASRPVIDWHALTTTWTGATTTRTTPATTTTTTATTRPPCGTRAVTATRKSAP